MKNNHSGLTEQHDDRSAILETLKDGMDDLQRAIETATPETPEEQRLQLQRYHELGYSPTSTASYNGILISTR